MCKNIVLTLINGKHEKVNYLAVSPQSIKKHVLGCASSLLLFAPTWYKSKKIRVYRFTYSDFKTDPELCALLFGHENNLGELALTETNTNYICGKYSSWGEIPRALFDVPLATLEKYNNDNRGKGAECYLIAEKGYIKASEKYDLKKVDVIAPDNTLSQVKASVMTEKGKGRGSRTNTNIPICEIIL